MRARPAGPPGPDGGRDIVDDGKARQALAHALGDGMSEVRAVDDDERVRRPATMASTASPGARIDRREAGDDGGEPHHGDIVERKQAREAVGAIAGPPTPRKPRARAIAQAGAAACHQLEAELVAGMLADDEGDVERCARSSRLARPDEEAEAIGLRDASPGRSTSSTAPASTAMPASPAAAARPTVRAPSGRQVDAEILAGLRGLDQDTAAPLGDRRAPVRRRRPTPPRRRNSATRSQHGVGAFGRLDGKDARSDTTTAWPTSSGDKAAMARSRASRSALPPRSGRAVTTPAPAISPGRRRARRRTGKPLASKKPTTPRRRLSSPPWTMRRISSRWRTACQPVRMRPSRGLCALPATTPEAPTPQRAPPRRTDPSRVDGRRGAKAGIRNPRCRERSIDRLAASRHLGRDLSRAAGRRRR